MPMTVNCKRPAGYIGLGMGEEITRNIAMNPLGMSTSQTCLPKACLTSATLL